MARKDLSRTVVEGRQLTRNKVERRVSMRSLRVDTRAYLSAVRQDSGAAEREPAPIPEPVRPGFDDKLSPAYRFLDSRVGKSWNKTRTLIAERFDTRTTPGRHIVHDHMLRDVASSLEAVGANWFRRGYYVDKHGILRKAPSLRYRPGPCVVFNHEKVVACLDGRQVGRVGSRYFWFVPARDADGLLVVADPGRIAVEYRVQGAQRGDPTPAFRQSKPLTKEDVEFFAGLDQQVQDAILRCAPTSVPKKAAR